MAGRRPTLLALALLTALVAGGWTGCRNEAPPREVELLDFVPADTVFFASPTQTTLARVVSRAQERGLSAYLLRLLGQDPHQAARRFGAAAGVLAALLRRQETDGVGHSIISADDPARDREQNGAVVAYTVGQAPVLRWKLADPGHLWRTLDSAEQAAGVDSPTSTRGELHLRRYRLELADEPLELVVAAGEGFAVAALHARDGDAPTLDQLIGREVPADPLGRVPLDNLARAYGFVPGTAAFIDNARLFGSLADDPDALLRRIGRLAAAADPELPDWARALGAPACRQALALLPEFWSRTVMGVTDLDPASGRLSQRLVFESEHQRALARLEAIRGHIPAFVRAPQTVLGMGLGIDFSTWLQPPRVETAASAETDPGTASAESKPDGAAPGTSDCPLLAAVQQRMPAAREANRPVSPLARLLPRVRGVGATIFQVPPAAGRGRRPGAASALMVSTAEPVLVRDALHSAIALQAHGRPPADHPHAGPWRFARAADERREPGLLLSSTAMVPIRPEEEAEDPAAANGLVSVRYRHGVPIDATAAALEPWLEPLPAAYQDAAGRMLHTLERLPYDLAVDLRVGQTGIELDVVVTPVTPATEG